MKRVEITDEELIRAARLLHATMVAAIPEDYHHEFSPEFHRKMNILRRKVRLRSALRTAAKSAAAVFLALLIGGGALLTFDADTRAAFFSWVREVYENSVFYQFAGEEEAEVLPDYRLAWVPEGYAETNVVGSDRQKTVIYQNGDNTEDIIYFSYSLIVDYKNMLMHSTGLRHEETIVNGYMADLYIPYDETIAKELVWIDDESGIVYRIDYYGETSHMLQMAESVYLEEEIKEK